MNITITQIFLTVFLIFAISRVFLRFKDGVLSLVGFFFWSSLFGSALLMVLDPGVTNKVAKMIGVGRGADVVIYVSLTLLFYLVFRLYIYLEDIKHDITRIVQKNALKDAKSQNAKKTPKD